MIKIKKLLTISGLLLGLAGSVLTVDAASVSKSSCRKVVQTMPCIAVIEFDGFNDGSWKFDDRARAVLAAGSVNNGKVIDKDDMYTSVQISEADYQKSVRDLFGSQKAVITAKSSADISEIIDAYMTERGEIVVCRWNLEVENDYEVKKDYFEKVATSKYKYTEDVYWGHWGNADRSANYKVEYTFTSDKGSRYGGIITDIKVSKIYKPYDANKIGVNTSSNQSAFYGIWVGASKNEAEAKKIANQCADLGGCVFLSTDWGNLNKEPYYVVTCGTYNTEVEANQMLEMVKQFNKNAYVKYSGDYLR